MDDGSGSVRRRDFLRRTLCALVSSAGLPFTAAARPPRSPPSGAARAATLFLCGDVMLGRGIDQILPHPGDPRLYEPYLRSALDYVALAERAHGTIPRPVSFSYIWGMALEEWEKRRPAARIVNLETAITRSATPWPKGINYRMSPDNLPCLQAAGIDVGVLSNNHVLDWGHEGLRETLEQLARAGIKTAGAGLDLTAARAPAELPLPGGGRVLLFAAATPDSGVAGDWAADAARPGVHRLPELSAGVLHDIAELVRTHKRPGDLAVFSIHWGGNWGYEIPSTQRAFAHGLIERGGVDLVHGHSSHHFKAIEVHRQKLILYGCGDFLDDYEGIAGYEAYRGDLGLMYFPKLERANGYLLTLELVPIRIRHLRIERPEAADRRWIAERLRRECRRFGGTIEASAEGTLAFRA